MPFQDKTSFSMLGSLSPILCSMFPSTWRLLSHDRSYTESGGERNGESVRGEVRVTQAPCRVLAGPSLRAGWWRNRGVAGTTGWPATVKLLFLNGSLFRFIVSPRLEGMSPPSLLLLRTTAVMPVQRQHAKERVIAQVTHSQMQKLVLPFHEPIVPLLIPALEASNSGLSSSFPALPLTAAIVRAKEEGQ